MNEKILIVDDDAEIAQLVSVYLKNEGFQTTVEYSGTEALKLIRDHKFDLAVLDVMLPDCSGFHLCEEIRSHYNYPVIMLTAKGEDIDKITGLTIGADDYITKPFNPVEMTARIKAQLRRYMRYNSQKRDDNIIDFQGLILNCSTHECTLYGEKLNLTPTEFSILQMLCENRGKVISSQDLFESIWKEKYFESNNTVMVHIRRIREKMHEQPRNPKFIKTVWGMGYKIEK